MLSKRERVHSRDVGVGNCSFSKDKRYTHMFLAKILT